MFLKSSIKNCFKDIKDGEWVPYFWYVVCPECKSKIETSVGEHFKVNENEKEIVYIDMDGVIVDFESGKKQKLADPGTIIIEQNTDRLNLKSGVGIDIFIYDGNEERIFS